MSIFYLHPDDRRWLKRWFRSNLVCFAAIIGFLLLLRFSTMVQGDATTPTLDNHNVVIPHGWRRTNRGWEHTTRWHYPPSADIPQVVAMPVHQPVWATLTMETVRGTSPLVIGLAQITAIATILRLSKRQSAVER